MNEEDLEAVRVILASLGRAWTTQDVADALSQIGAVVSDALVLVTVQALRVGSVGLGPLQPLISLPGVTDILVDGPGRVLVDRGRGLEDSEVSFDSDAQVRRLAVRLAASAGRRLDDACPYVDARLADGLRFHAILSPIAAPGTCISLRVPAKSGFRLVDWLSHGSISQETVALLRQMLARKISFLISGGTGSGKTTLLSSMLCELDSSERVLIVEDSRELDPKHDYCVHLESRPSNAEGAGAITMTTLVRQALRMRPDRVVVGEIRGGELCDLLRALNTGHEGGCGTIHANSVTDVPARLEALAALGGLDRLACHAQVASAIQAILHVKRCRDGVRRLVQIGVLSRRPDALVEVALALEYDGVKGARMVAREGFKRFQELIGAPCLLG